MCDPVIGSSMAVTLIGATVSAMAQKQAGDFKAQVDRNNAVLQERAATDADSRGSFMAGQSMMKGSQLIGQARAGAGASGIAVESGSVVDTNATTRAMTTMDAEMQRYNAHSEALGHQIQASNFLADSTLASQTGSNGATTALLGGFSSIAGQYTTGYIHGLMPKLGG